jgi:hypothetical protein
LNEWLEELDNKLYLMIDLFRFIKANMNILSMKNSFINITPFSYSNKKGFRMDRCIEAEVLGGHEGSQVNLSFQY